MKQKTRKINLFFIVLFLIYSACLFFLFYNQCMLWEDGRFFSDMRAYILEIQGADSGYSFPYPVFFGLAKFLSTFIPIYVAIPIVLVGLNGLGMIATVGYIEEQGFNKRVSAILCLIIFLVSMLFLSFSFAQSEGWGDRYLGVFSPNPYQNATYIATRPFAILLFIQFVKISYKEFSVKDGIWFGVFMILSTLTKPSFIFVIAPVFAVVFFIKWVLKKKFDKRDFIIILAGIITILILLYQFSAVFTGDGGLKLGPGIAWHIWTPGIKEAIFKANLFPFFFLIFHLKDLKNNLMYRYSWIIYLIGMITFYLLYEQGPRINDANFAWGYMHGLFFVFFSSVINLGEEWIKYGKKNKWYNWISTALLLWHLICGIFFFIYMLNGGSASHF